MIQINSYLSIQDNEFDIVAIRAQGSGGQKVNKVACAVHLRFDISNSSLPSYCKSRLLSISDQRITKEGIAVIKAQSFRTLEQNKKDATDRLRDLILSALQTRKKRVATKPTKSSQRKRLDKKCLDGNKKKLRSKVDRSHH